MSGELSMLARLYEAYNRQDAEGLLDLMSDDVDWPDGRRRLHGKAALSRYWEQQWRATRTHDEPVEVALIGSDRATVRVDQVVRDHAGVVTSSGTFCHSYQFDGGRVTRLDIERVGTRTSL